MVGAGSFPVALLLVEAGLAVEAAVKVTGANPNAVDGPPGTAMLPAPLGAIGFDVGTEGSSACWRLLLRL